MSSSNREIDFTALESFHILYKNLWSMNIAYRLKMNVLDTILFKDGSPFLWLFTSEQSGEIMKKKAEKLESIPEIIRTLKLKSRAYTGSKDSTMRNKIATVWYMESERKVNSYIVDESELKSILSNSLTEILCVQTYIGAVCFRGNGIFEHRVWTQRDGAVKHITYETINMERGCEDRFTCESEKLAITEHQHGALCSMSNQLITHMGFMNKCRVSGLIVQVVFTEGWVPHLVGAKKVTFSNVPPGLGDMREQLVYPSGNAPQPPVFNANSLLLPISLARREPNRRTSTAVEGAATGTAALNGTYCDPHANSNNSNSTVPAAAISDASQSIPLGSASASTKVRSSSLSYQHSGSTKYTNFIVEQERKEAVLQRQMSVSSEKYVTEAIEEAKAIAAAADEGLSANMAGLGSSSSKAPFAKTLGSSKFVGPSSSSGKKRHFSQSAKLPSMMSANDTSLSSKLGTLPAQHQQQQQTTGNEQETAGANINMHQSNPQSNQQTDYHHQQQDTLRGPVPLISKQHSTSFLTTAAAESVTAATGQIAATAGPTIMSDKPPLRRAFTTSNLEKATSLREDTATAAAAAAPLRPLKSTKEGVEEGERELLIPNIDISREPSRIQYSSEDYFATVHLASRPSTIHLLQAAKDQANRPASQQQQQQQQSITAAAAAALMAESKKPAKSTAAVRQHSLQQTTDNTTSVAAYSSAPGSPKRRIQTGADPMLTATTLSAAAGAEYPDPAKTAPIHRLFRPDSASSVTKLRQTMDKAKIAEGASTGLLAATATGRRTQANTTTSAGSDGLDSFQLKHFEINTEARKTQTAFNKTQLNDHEAALKEQEKVFTRRRPISAPHTTRPKHQVPPELLPPGDSGNMYDTEQYHREYNETGKLKRNLQRYHPKGFSLSKPLPLSGILCFGTYCNFSTRAKNAAVNENKEGAPAKEDRCSDCPHQVTYKSILLAKAETRFLGCDIDENIESLIDQIRLTSVSTEQLYTYLVRRHLNRVAEKCQEEARRMQLAGTAQTHKHAHTATSVQDQQQADLNLVYRRLVYADALAHIHPSRFYYTVPLCEMCYKVYTFMDAQREVAILHNIDSHQQALAAAAASAEKAKFTFTARTEDGRRRQTIMPGKMVKVPVLSAAKKNPHFADHPAGHDAEDPYEADQLLDTDEFIPHHSAQRDIYNDQHKKDNFATTLRNNVASLQAATAEKARQQQQQQRSGRHSPGALSKRDKIPSPPHSTHKVHHDAAAEEGKSPNYHIDMHNTSSPPHSSRRKVVQPRDRVPINHYDHNRFNDTSDSGIGSKGRPHPGKVLNVASTAGTISSWVQLLRSSAEGPPAAGPNAQYDRVFGWRTNQEWDNQGNAPHLRPTSSSAIRLQTNRHLQQRPHSAQAALSSAHRHQSSSNSSGYETGPSVHVQFANSGSQLQYSQDYSGSAAQYNTTHGEFTLNPQPGSPSSRGKKRPNSAGAVPYRKAHGKRSSSKNKREETIAALELKLAGKMLELSRHLAESDFQQHQEQHQQHQQAPPKAHTNQNSDNYPSSYMQAYPNQRQHQHQHTTGEEEAEDNSSFSAAYAYSSLPFMAAPYLPAPKGNTDCVADAAYTQLQIDPATQRVIPPQPTPQQVRQQQLEQERREIAQRLEAERQRLRQEEAARLRQLQQEREEIAERQARRASSTSLKPTPSTEFIPVHALSGPNGGNSRTPPWRKGPAPGEAGFESDGVDEEVAEEGVGVEGGGEEDVYSQERVADQFQQEQQMLQLQQQQQREFRQLQLQQQELHQKHQQQMLQQQIHYHERRRAEEEEGEGELQLQQQLQQHQYQPSDSQVLRELNIIPVPDDSGAGGGGNMDFMTLRESVEMSPMSPPIFEFLNANANANTAEAFPTASTRATEGKVVAAQQQHQQSTEDDYFFGDEAGDFNPDHEHDHDLHHYHYPAHNPDHDGGVDGDDDGDDGGDEDGGYGSDEDFVRNDSGKSLSVVEGEHGGERDLRLEHSNRRHSSSSSASVSARPQSAALAIDTTERRRSSCSSAAAGMRFTPSAESFVSPVEEEAGRDNMAEQSQSPSQSAADDGLDRELGSTPEPTSVKARYIDNMPAFAGGRATESSHLNKRPVEAADAATRAEYTNTDSNKDCEPLLMVLSPFPELASPFPQALSPPAVRQPRAAESFPSPDAAAIFIEGPREGEVKVRRNSGDQALQPC